jgi:hypothetical protein
VTSPAPYLGRPGAREARPAVTTISAAHHASATGPLEAPLDALGTVMLMADRFLLNVILE